MIKKNNIFNLLLKGDKSKIINFIMNCKKFNEKSNKWLENNDPGYIKKLSYYGNFLFQLGGVLFFMALFINKHKYILIYSYLNISSGISFFTASMLYIIIFVHYIYNYKNLYIMEDNLTRGTGFIGTILVGAKKTSLIGKACLGCVAAGVTVDTFYTTITGNPSKIAEFGKWSGVHVDSPYYKK